MVPTPCANCGAPIQAGAASCAGCGAPTTVIPVAPPPPPGAPGTAGPAAPPLHGFAAPPTPGAPPPPATPAPGSPPPPGAPASQQPGSLAAPAPSTGFPAAPTAAAPPPPGAPAYQQPAFQQSGTAGATERPPASGRNTAAGVIALLGVALVVIGTFLPIVEYDLGSLGAGIEDSVNGWSDAINDGPIHVVVGLVPLVMGILALMNRARVAVKVLLIVSAVIGFFWVFVRLADISGSLEEGDVSAFVAEVADPGVGLYVIAAGWVLVLIAGIVATAKKPRPVPAAPYAQAYPSPPGA
ncbi:MAG: zinc ribbon domain-containing protein [Acidimicrobiales bacterium]